MRSPAAKMSSPPAAPVGGTPRRGQIPKNKHHADLMTRLGSRLVKAATHRLIADQLIAPVRPRTRESDDWVERPARRLVNRPRTNPNNHTR
jgi:hypothetical protein